MARKGKLSWAEHQHAGALLKRTRDDCIDIRNAYPQTLKVCRLATRVINAIDALRSELENQSFRDCPADARIDAYYGSTARW